MEHNLKAFFDEYIAKVGKYNAKQKEGLTFLLTKLGESKRITLLPAQAYVLATVAWETAYTFQPITEYGSVTYLTSKKYYPYIGRGYIQLTWRSNYEKFGKALRLDLVNHPNLANEKGTAWKILEMGMTDNFGVQDPDFTSHTLEDFITAETKYSDHFLNARRIINPKDLKSCRPIADLAVKFLSCLTASATKELVIDMHEHAKGFWETEIKEVN